MCESVHVSSNSSNESLFLFHSDTFNWVWSRIVQACADDFRDYWNTHKIRHQAEKVLPSGVAPCVVFDFPECYSLKDCGVPIDLAVVAAFRKDVTKSRDECFTWVDAGFEADAQGAYAAVGSPELTMLTGWDIFHQMIAVLE